MSAWLGRIYKHGFMLSFLSFSKRNSFWCCSTLSGWLSNSIFVNCCLLIDEFFRRIFWVWNHLLNINLSNNGWWQMIHRHNVGWPVVDVVDSFGNGWKELVYWVYNSIRVGYRRQNKNDKYDCFLSMLIKVPYCSHYFLFFHKTIFVGSQWGWLPYDIGPTETLPFVCETPIRETYGILDNYRSIGIVLFSWSFVIRFLLFFYVEFGLPSNIEQRFVPRAPKFYEQPQDQEFGRIDQITLGGETTFGISKVSLAIVVTLTCRADAYPVADY